MIFGIFPCIGRFGAAHNFPMMKMTKREMGIKTAKLFFLTAAVYLGMRFIFPIVLPFFIAWIAAHFLYPLVKLFEKKFGMKKPLARILTFGIFLTAVGIAAAGFVWLCYSLGAGCLAHMDDFMESADRIFGICCDKLEAAFGIAAEETQRTIRSSAFGLTKGAVEYSKDAGWFLLGIFANLFVTFVSVFLFLSEYEKIMDGLRKTEIGRKALDVMREIKTAAGTYLWAQCRIMAIVTAVCITGLFLLGTPYAFWLGLAIGLFDALPFFGTGTVFVPWAVIELLLGGYKEAAGYLGIYIVTSLIRELLEPKLVGKDLGISPLAVLMSIYIGVQIYGGVGIVLGPVSALLIYEVYK